MDGQNEQQQTPANGHSTDPRPEQQQQHDVKQEVTDQTTEQPSQVSDEEVKQRLLVLLGKSDLSTTTGEVVGCMQQRSPSTLTHQCNADEVFQTAEKMLRKQLEQELGADLSSKKALIRTEVRAGRNAAAVWRCVATQLTWVPAK
jgi:hypothetical protein